MTVNVLIDGAAEPTDELVERTLGKAWPFFVELRRETAACEQDWRHYGKKYGWKLKVHAEGKSLLELTAADGWFLVAMAIRDKERQELAADRSTGVLGELATAAAAAPEGYGIRIEVRDRASCDRAKELARFIMARRVPPRA